MPWLKGARLRLAPARRAPQHYDAARIRPFDGKKGQRHVNSRDQRENNVFHHHIAAALNYRIDKADHDIHTDCHHQQG
jgi:hypothetical protein